MKSDRLRKALIYSMLTITLIAAWFAPSETEKRENQALIPHASAGTPLVDSDSRQSSQRVEGAVSRLIPLKMRATGEDADSSLFVQQKPQELVRSQQQEIQVSVLTSPQAPPIPFQVVGRYESQEDEAVFLIYQDQNLVARQGETLAGAYKVEKIEPRRMILRYLPLNEVQAIELGEGIGRIKNGH